MAEGMAMKDWAGFRTFPRPVLAPGAASALHSALNGIEATVKPSDIQATATAMIQGQFVGPISPSTFVEPHEVTMRCAGCRTNYGRITFYASGQIELFCTRSKCRRRTVIPVG